MEKPKQSNNKESNQTMTNNSVQHLSINDISLSLRFRAIDPETVADYVFALANKGELPDITVAFDRERSTYYLVDGFHRLEAHRYHGAVMITANVIEMPKQDALWLALGANAKNGRRLSNEDKRNAVALAIKEFPNASSRAIATHVGCSHSLVQDVKDNGCQILPPAPAPLFEEVAEIVAEEGVEIKSTEADDENAEDEDDDDGDDESNDKPKRVTGVDGKSYPAKKKDKEKPTTMTSFGELAASLPYTYDEQKAAQAIEDALFALPGTLTVEVKGEYLVVSSTDPDKPPLRTVPLKRGTDWKAYPIRPFFDFTKADWDILENGGIKTVGDLATLVSTDPKEQKQLPKFGKGKVAKLEEQFVKFWGDHPELCE